MNKQELRKLLRKKRRNLSEEEIQIKSLKIIDKILKDPDFIKASCIGIYISARGEVDVSSLLTCGKRIAVPKVKGDKMDFYEIHDISELERGTYGILEPKEIHYVDPNEIDVLICPLVGFDASYQRLGQGGGYYDKYLSTFKGKTIGVAYSFQKVEQLDIEEHDIPLDKIYTEIKE